MVLVSDQEEAHAILSNLSENQLRDEIVVPLFDHEGWGVEVLDRKDEILHGCDLLLTDVLHGRPMFVGVQLKVKEDVSTVAYIKNEIETRAERGVKFEFGEEGNGRLSQFLWITTGRMPTIGGTRLRNVLEANNLLKGKVEVLDLDKLYKKLLDSGAMRKIGPLRIPFAKLQIKKHRERGEGIWAAHWCYRAFREYLLKESPDISRALECLEAGLQCLSEDPWLSIYFSRTYRLVFEAWMELLRRLPRLGQWKRLEDALVEGEAQEILEQPHGMGWSINLLLDFEFMFRQLVQLEERYVDSPAGLSTLLICRLLLRFGFPPTEKGIAARFLRIEKELEAEDGKSIDDKCSLCSGVALSCFSLARTREKDVVPKIADWILSLEDDRYCHILHRSIDLPENEHALHYAAEALLGLLDLGREHDSDLQPVVDVFFRSLESRDARGFFIEWVKYSYVDRFEVYRFILATFLRYFLMGKSLSSDRCEQLREAIRLLVRELNEETPRGTRAYIFYPTRTNLTSFILGMLLEVREAVELARLIGGLLHRLAMAAGSGRDGQLWDSNVERTVVFIESLLEYWETVIYLKDIGRPIADLLPIVVAPQAAS